ncbi:MAG: hypothetical protein ABIH28_00895 [archaeon]
MVLTEKDIESFISKQDLKRTLTKTGTYFEQKITPDLLSFIAKAIIEFTKRDTTPSFTDKDIRSSDFFIMMIKDYFSKPTQSQKTENEYNKLSSYQIGLLSFSGILKEVGTHPYSYKISNLGILEFIAQSDMNALLFLKIYVIKMLKDNNLLKDFNRYKEKPTQESYDKLKKQFWEWARKNTSVRGEDPKHSYRVFNKIFNLFAYLNSISGQHLARIKSGICPYSYLIYNSINWRDKNKAKNISRKEFQEELEVEGVEIGVSVEKAKKEIKKKYPTTEVFEFKEYIAEKSPSIQAHHIFPTSSYPKFSDYVENIISLSVGQHMSYAHQGNTHWIDPDFQVVCLLSKLKNIKISFDKNENFYDINKFIEILNDGLNLKVPQDSNIEFIKKKLLEIRSKISN